MPTLLESPLDLCECIEQKLATVHCVLNSEICEICETETGYSVRLNSQDASRHNDFQILCSQPGPHLLTDGYKQRLHRHTAAKRIP